MNFKYCALALATTVILTGCNSSSEDSTTGKNDDQSYTPPIASAVKITGDSLVGSTLTGGYTFTDPNYSPRPEGASAYSWKVQDNDDDPDNDVSIGSERTILLGDEELDKHVYFCTTPVAEGNSNTVGEEKCSAPTMVNEGIGSKPEASNVVIDIASPTVGDTLTGSYDYSDADADPEAVSQFAWKQNGQIIAGVNEQSLVLNNLQEGMAIEFCVTPVSQNPDDLPSYPVIGDQICSDPTAPTAALSGSAPVASNTVINGEHTVGSVLTGSYDYSDDDGDLEGSSVLSWKRDSSAIDGETSSTYTIQSSDKGTALEFCVKPVAQTGLEKDGIESCSAPVNDISDPVGEIPGVTLNTITSDKEITHAQVGDVLTGSYQYTASASGAADDSTINWKAGGVTIDSVQCTVGNTCDLTITDAQLGKALTYCVTPKATDSAAGIEDCSPAITTFGIKLTGSLEFGKTLTANVYGYQAPTYSWKVDTSNTDGPTNDTARSEKATTASYTIGDTVLATISSDFEINSGNNNGLVDDADWDQAIRTGTIAADTVNAAHYIGKDVELCVTTEKGNLPCLLASEQGKTDVTGGVYYDETAPEKRAIEPIREVTFKGSVVYHRPLSFAETVLQADAGFGTVLPTAHYKQNVTGIEWASFKMEHTDGTTPGLTVCLDLYDAGAQWYLPASRSDSAYNPDWYATDPYNNAAPLDDKNALLIKFANIFNKTTSKAAYGLIGSYNDKTSPIFGWPITGAAATPYWSATKLLTDDTKVNSVKFYDNGASGNNTATNGRFVSCVRSAS